jgi:hypothetical protein
MHEKIRLPEMLNIEFTAAKAWRGNGWGVLTE